MFQGLDLYICLEVVRLSAHINHISIGCQNAIGGDGKLMIDRLCLGGKHNFVQLKYLHRQGTK